LIVGDPKRDAAGFHAVRLVHPAPRARVAAMIPSFLSPATSRPGAPLSPLRDGRVVPFFTDYLMKLLNLVLVGQDNLGTEDHLYQIPPGIAEVRVSREKLWSPGSLTEVYRVGSLRRRR
jgi:hypothetical protein